MAAPVAGVTAAVKVDDAPAVLPTESVHVTIEKLSPSQLPKAATPVRTTPPADKASGTTGSSNVTANNKTSQPAVIDVPPSSNNGLRTIELSSGRVREGFSNGDIIVTLLPVNTNWPWITPARFRPELVPEELMAQGLTVSFV